MRRLYIWYNCSVVGALEHEWIIFFPSYWEFHHPNWLSLHDFSEGRLNHQPVIYWHGTDQPQKRRFPFFFVISDGVFEGMIAGVSPAKVVIYCDLIKTNGGLHRDITYKNWNIEGLGFLKKVVWWCLMWFSGDFMGISVFFWWMTIIQTHNAMMA